MTKSNIKALANQLKEMGVDVKINQQLGKISVAGKTDDWERVLVRSQNIREGLERSQINPVDPQYQVTVILESLTQSLIDIKHKKLNEFSIDIKKGAIANHLYESIDLEKAEIILAAQSVSSEFQKAIEKMAKLQVEDVIHLTDQISQHFGRNDAQTFADAVNGCFDNVLECLRECKNTIDDQIAFTLEGKTPEPDLARDMEVDDVPNMDVDDMDDMDDIDSNIDALDHQEGPTAQPLGRARKR
jgi:hypothetical protein